MAKVTAQRVDDAFEDPSATLSIIRAAGPMWPLANYAANDAEMATLSASGSATFVPPWFRQDFVRNGEVLVDGAEEILANPRFVEAARSIGGAGSLVEPTSVYVNVMGPTPFAFPPHLDVPAFVGITRAEYPIWLLKVMMSSGLFEAWRIQIATAVSWFYGGPGGEFHYWPEGGHGPMETIDAPYRNVAVVADNEATFHAVGPVGPPDATMPDGLGSDCRLVRGSQGWDIIDGAGTVIDHIADDVARITVSWKANVYPDAERAEAIRRGDGALTLDAVVETFCADLERRGVAADRPENPLDDAAWTAILASTYPEVAPVLG